LLANEFFPQRIVELQPTDDLRRVPWYRFHTAYPEHLLATMGLMADCLNTFLYVTGSRQTFTFGTSISYNDLTFEELLYHEWVTMHIARRFEQQLLKQLQSAYHAISMFINKSELSLNCPSQALSPAFTTDSSFAYEIRAILEANNIKFTITYPF
jgi:hypothetical protein